VPVVFNAEWYILTAGHAVKPYLDGIRSQQIFSTGGALFDSVASIDTEANWFPFEIADYCEYVIDDESLGLDYAMLKLSSNHSELIKNRNILPLYLTMNDHEEIQSSAMCIVAGMPDEHGTLLSTEPGVRNNIFMRPSTVPVIREDDDSRPFPRLVGRIKSMENLRSIVGMSGGPVFGFANDSYTIVAIQSRWNKNTKTIYATKTTSICRHFAKWKRDSTMKNT
jgi:hypothetical protein